MRRVIVLPDIHAEETDRKTLSLVEAYMADHKWDEVIYLGDFLDMSCISFHNKGKPRLVEGKTVAGSYAIGNRILDRHEKILKARNPEVNFTYLLGNHEDRVERLIDEFPQMKGTIEVSIGLKLKERGCRVVDSWRNCEPYRIGKAVFIHGLHQSGEHHAKAAVETYSTNVFMGHTHSIQEHSKKRFGDNETVTGASIGFLGKYQQSWLGQKPTNWQQAFGVFHFRDDGEFNHYIIRVKRHRFVSPEGKLYE